MTTNRVGIFARPNRNIVTNAAEGFNALGFKSVWGNPWNWKPDQREPFAFVALWSGGDPASIEIIKEYKRFGTETLCLEKGYIKRGEYFSIGIGHHYWLPDFECPDDRFNSFGISFESRRKTDGYILVVGQNAAVDKRIVKVIEEIKRHTDRTIRFRPHPISKTIIKGVENSDPKETTLVDDLNGAFCVVCHTSNVAHDALIKGIPVFCSENAMFKDLANTDLQKIEKPYFPGKKKLRSYFSRLAYAVWTKEEISNGTAIEFYLKIINGEDVESCVGVGPVNTIKKLLKSEPQESNSHTPIPSGDDQTKEKKETKTTKKKQAVQKTVKHTEGLINGNHINV